MTITASLGELAHAFASPKSSAMATAAVDATKEVVEQLRFVESQRRDLWVRMAKGGEHGLSPEFEALVDFSEQLLRKLQHPGTTPAASNEITLGIAYADEAFRNTIARLDETAAREIANADLHLTQVSERYDLLLQAHGERAPMISEAYLDLARARSVSLQVRREQAALQHEARTAHEALVASDVIGPSEVAGEADRLRRSWLGARAHEIGALAVHDRTHTESSLYNATSRSILVRDLETAIRYLENRLPEDMRAFA